MSKAPEMKKIVRACQDQGLTKHDRPKNGHYLISNFDLVTDENGNVRPGERLIKVSIACSPREDRGVNNAVARLRRELGFQWKGH
jgi:hypothetical protein